MIDFLLFGDEVARAAGDCQRLLRSQAGEVGAQQEAGAILIGFVDARIKGRALEPPGGRVQTRRKRGDGILGAKGHHTVALFYRDTRGQMLLLEEPAKPGALHLCEEDRQLRLAIGPGEARDDNLLA